MQEVLVPLAEDINRIAVEGIPDEEVEMICRTLLSMIRNLAKGEAQALEAGTRVTATRELALKKA